MTKFQTITGRVPIHPIIAKFRNVAKIKISQTRHVYPITAKISNGPVASKPTYVPTNYGS